MIVLDRIPGAPFTQPWRNTIAVGRAYDLVRADLLEHLRLLQRRIGFRHCRFHAVFDDDMQVVVRRPDGTLAFQWRNVDAVYDALLGMGLKPFVELNPMPTALASGTQTMFWFKMNVTPPKDYGEWEQLVEAFARHLIDRYGIAEVRTWWFEVWNEPNLSGFWSGTKAEYFQLYDASARALKRVDPALRVGGPASSKASWLEDMIAHSDSTAVPLDFVSSHLYPQDEYVDYRDRVGSPYPPGRYFIETVRDAVARVRARRPGMPVHWTEWNTMACASSAGVDWTTNATNDALHGAATAARAMVELDGDLDSLCWWVASDVFAESGIAQAPFSMTYGLLDLRGVPKAAFHAFDFLARLSGDRLAAQVAGAPPAAGLAAARDGEAVRLVAWNQRLLEDAAPPAWDDVVNVPVETVGEHLVLTARVAAGAGSAYEAWLAMGAPQDLSPTMELALRASAEPRWTVARVSSAGGLVAVPLRLEPGELLFIEVRPVGQRSLPRTVSAKALAAWDAAMGERSR